MAQPLAGKVCIVTGATRGIGRGIALQLGQAGATVYITGRTLKADSSSDVGGSLEDTAAEVKSRGGQCIPVQCDHSKDSDIESLFDRVSREQDGQLDILVNNAYAAVTAIIDNSKKKFWESEPSMWDTVNNVGLRNHYICSVYAARLMVPRQQGLIVNISSAGGLRYLFNVAYGVGKEAVDRMAADCAQELKKHKVAFVSLWPGLVATEHIQNLAATPYGGGHDGFKKAIDSQGAETTEFPGKCLVALASDKNIMNKSGRILLSGDLADEYGLVDVNGQVPKSMRSITGLVSYIPSIRSISWVFPRWLKLPRWVLHMAGNKF